jgi:hypothetical protein
MCIVIVHCNCDCRVRVEVESMMVEHNIPRTLRREKGSIFGVNK